MTGSGNTVHHLPLIHYFRSQQLFWHMCCFSQSNEIKSEPFWILGANKLANVLALSFTKRNATDHAGELSSCDAQEVTFKLQHTYHHTLTPIKLVK